MIVDFRRKRSSIACFFVGMIILGASCSQNSTTSAPSETKVRRIVTLNGAVTEVVAAAGFADEIVGVDVTSTFPPEVSKLPKIGHNRNIQAEGVLSLSPTMILGNEGNLNPDIQQQFHSVDVALELMKEREWTVTGTEQFIRQLCQLLEVPQAAEKMIGGIHAQLNQIQPFMSPPRVLFIYARGAGSLMAAGSGTQMQAIIELAGGQNAAQGFEQFKALNTEALVQANPEVILLFNNGLESLEGTQGLLEIPGMKATLAGQRRAIISMDGPLLANFGPRLGEAALFLNQELHLLVHSAP